MNKNTIKNILLQEYEKRIVTCLIEGIQLKSDYGKNVWDDAEMLKVRHEKTGLEFTFGEFVGKDKVKLYVPEESRFETIDAMSSILEYSELDGEEFFVDDQERYVDYDRHANKKSDRNYVIIPLEKFEKEFIL